MGSIRLKELLERNNGLRKLLLVNEDFALLEGGIGSEFVLGMHGGKLLEMGRGVVRLVLLEVGVAEVLESVRVVFRVLGDFNEALNRLGMAVRLVVQKSQLDQRMGKMGTLRVFLNKLGQRGTGVLCIFLF